MKRFLLPFAVLATFAASVFGQSGPLTILLTPPRTVWSVQSVNTDVDGSAELMAINAFTQMDGADTIEVLSSSASDDQRVILLGVKSDSVRTTETFRVNGTSVVVLANQWRYFENAWIDSGGEAVGTITLRNDDGDATITTIAAGDLETGVAHRFFGELPNQTTPENFYLFYMEAENRTGEGATVLEGRFYPDWADAEDVGDGYIPIATLVVPDTIDSAGPAVWRPPYPLGYTGKGANGKYDYGYFAIYATSTDADATISVRAQGATR